MKVISSYQKLKLRIAELEKRNHDLRKAIVEDDFRVLTEVKLAWKMREDIDRSLMFGERNYPKPKEFGAGFTETDWMSLRTGVRGSSVGLTEHIRKYPTSFAEAFKAKGKWIVELEEGVWLADWEGDPGRTTVKESAKVFSLLTVAYSELGVAKEFRRFPNAKVEAVKPEDDGFIPNTNPETKGLFSGHRYRKLGKINLDLLPDFLKKKKK